MTDRPILTPSLQLLRFFKYDHLPEPLREISKQFFLMAHGLEDGVPDGPEKTAGLRKLLEAKDCFVRAALPTEGEAYIGKTKAQESFESVERAQDEFENNQIALADSDYSRSAPLRKDDPTTPFYDARDEVGRFTEQP